MLFRLIVFDFDGTLVDSNSIKRHAYDEIFADQPECVRALPETLDALSHASRDEIIKSLVERIPDLTADQRLAETMLRTESYTRRVDIQILERAGRSPAGALLPRWQSHAALYVCSLTPTHHLKRILGAAGWLPYFEGVEGYPVDKADMLHRTVSRHGLRADQALMVGDGDGDEVAAFKTGTAFFRVAEIRDLARLDQYLST